MQQSTLNVTLQQSGQPVAVPNSVLILSGGSLTIVYTVNGTPASLIAIVQGVKNASGNSPVLDTYVGTAGTTRTVSLTDTYDSFLVTAAWTGGSASVSVGVSITGTGAGQVFQGSFQFVQSGVGSPAGVLAAPVGTLYVNLNGTPGAVLFVKESGTGTSGWAAK